MKDFNFVRHYPSGFLKDDKSLFIEAETQLSKMVDQFSTYENYLFVVLLVKCGNGYVMFSFMGLMGLPWEWYTDMKEDTCYLYREPYNSRFKGGIVNKSPLKYT